MRSGRLAAIPAPALVIGAMLSAQFGSAAATTLFDDMSPMAVVFLRQLLAALVLVAAVRPRLKSWTKQQWVSATAYGGALAGMNASFYASIQTVPLGLAVTLEFLGPLVMALVMSRRARDVAWALLAGTGVALLGWTSHASGNWTGYALALLAGAFWVSYILVTRRVGIAFDGLDGLAVALAIAAVLTAPLGARAATVVLTDGDLFLKALAVAVLSSVVVYVLEMAALRRMPPRVFGIMLSLAPAVAALAGFVVLGQVLSPAELGGLALVSAASAAVAWESRGSTGAPLPQD